SLSTHSPHMNRIISPSLATRPDSSSRIYRLLSLTSTQSLSSRTPSLIFDRSTHISTVSFLFHQASHLLSRSSPLFVLAIFALFSPTSPTSLRTHLASSLFRRPTPSISSSISVLNRLCRRVCSGWALLSCMLSTFALTDLLDS